mgnify:CR=1 FL=1
MTKRFDLIVIGTGTAAGAVATRCRAAGWSVAVIDDKPYGGTCALRGCDPKKMLRRGAEIIDAARHMAGHGIVPDGLRIDWTALQGHKRSFTDPVPMKREQGFAGKGIATFHGHARFIGPNTVAAGDEELYGRHIVIATGMTPRPLGIPGEALVTTSDEFLELEHLPRRVLLIGGGVIGGTLVAVYWDQLGTSLALPYPKINLLESFGPASGLLLTFAGLAVAMLLVHLNARRFQPKRSPAREPGQTESLA